MKRSRVLVEERREAIAHMVCERNVLRVGDIAQRFGLSAMTVRRDLQYLEDHKRIKRIHGGAVDASPRKLLTEEEKLQVYRELIARASAGMVEDGDRLFINGSITALGLLKHLGGKNVTVVTNNAASAEQECPPNVELYLTGGVLRGKVMVGDAAIRNLIDMYADKTFLGCARVYSDGEFSYNIPTEISINEVMVSHTRKLFIMADHTKLAPVGNYGDMPRYGSCTYEHQCTLITDEQADAGIVQELRERGIMVHQVKMEDYYV